MKIEFCCEEMLNDYFINQDENVFELTNDMPNGTGKWNLYYIARNFQLHDTCPHCGAKIEIAIKEAHDE